jgi:micrococcal nuclease
MRFGSLVFFLVFASLQTEAYKRSSPSRKAMVAESAAHLLEGKIIHVYDGDTVTLLKDQVNYKIRLAEIDAPENGQAFGNRSREYLKKRVWQQIVLASCNPQKDRYQRYLCFLYDQKRQNINLEMVQNGWAWAYEAYAQNPQIFSAQQSAREKKLGLWQDPRPVPPWVWRKQRAPLKKVQLSFE